ncbi:LysR family transcriptional regulator [Nocardia sp. R16R-3T]
MDLDAVRTFVAVAETGQFQAAADELGITQQAASKRVAALERELGVQLFARIARGVRLNVDGQALLPNVRQCAALQGGGEGGRGRGRQGPSVP